MGVRMSTIIALVAADASEQLERHSRLNPTKTVELIQVSNLSDLYAAVQRRPGGSYVVLDERILEGTLDHVARQMIGKHNHVSMILERISASTEAIVTGSHLIDQIVVVGLADSLAAFSENVVRHARNLGARHPSDHLIEVGSIFDVGFAPDSASKPDSVAYEEARKLSILTQGFGAFGSGFRLIKSQLRQFPLLGEGELPWRPAWETGKKKDERPTLEAIFQDLGPNESGVRDTDQAAEMLHRLLGKTIVDAGWRAAWTQGRERPPRLLITGESGTGKTLVARTLARALLPEMERLEARFVSVNAAALSDKQFEHQLMGSAAGVWTGVGAVVGDMVRAAYGVFFLDEIGDLHPEAQAALLTYLDTGLLRPAAITPFPAFQHFFAATNRDVDEGVSRGRFRNDLLARFELRLELPPLRHRSRQARAHLVDFAAQDPLVNPRNDGQFTVTSVSRSAWDALLGRDFADGNFRELQTTVKEALVAARLRLSTILDIEDLPPERPSNFVREKEEQVVWLSATQEHIHDNPIEVRTDAELRKLATLVRRPILAHGEDRYVLLPEVQYHAKVGRDTQ